jgi:hypothetical protein
MTRDRQRPGATVETIFAELRGRVPSVRIERLPVMHPADDDNLWFITANGGTEVQIESGGGGSPPFLLEGEAPDQRGETSDVAETVQWIVAWLDRV